MLRYCGFVVLCVLCVSTYAGPPSTSQEARSNGDFQQEQGYDPLPLGGFPDLKINFSKSSAESSIFVLAVIGGIEPAYTSTAASKFELVITKAGKGEVVFRESLIAVVERATRPENVVLSPRDITFTICVGPDKAPPGEYVIEVLWSRHAFPVVARKDTLRRLIAIEVANASRVESMRKDFETCAKVLGGHVDRLNERIAALEERNISLAREIDELRTLIADVASKDEGNLRIPTSKER